MRGGGGVKAWEMIGVGVRYVDGQGKFEKNLPPLNLKIIFNNRSQGASIQTRGKLQHQQLREFTMTFLFRRLQFLAMSINNKAQQWQTVIPVKMQDFIFSNPTFILRAQESHPTWAPYNVSTQRIPHFTQKCSHHSHRTSHQPCTSYKWCLKLCMVWM